MNELLRDIQFFFKRQKKPPNKTNQPTKTNKQTKPQAKSNKIKQNNPPPKNLNKKHKKPTTKSKPLPIAV